MARHCVHHRGRERKPLRLLARAGDSTLGLHGAGTKKPSRHGARRIAITVACLGLAFRVGPAERLDPMFPRLTTTQLPRLLAVGRQRRVLAE